MATIEEQHLDEMIKEVEEKEEEAKKAQVYAKSTRVALIDFIPVLIYVGTMIIVIITFPYVWFIIGVVFIAVAGLLKATYHLLYSLGKDIPLLNKQFFFTFALGLIFMLVNFFVYKNVIDWKAINTSMGSLPANIFFIIFAILLVVSNIFAVALEKKSPYTYWIKQVTYICMQSSLLLAVIFTTF